MNAPSGEKVQLVSLNTIDIYPLRHPSIQRHNDHD